MNHQTAVLNADYQFINFVHWTRAMSLLHKARVEVVKYSDVIIRTCNEEFQVPAVIRLMKLVRLVYKREVPFSKRSVFVRDKYRCQYCGEKCSHPTIDHIIPQSMAGKSTWENCVACCKKCNTKKGCKTMKEAHMFLLKRPVQPTIGEYIQMKFGQMGVAELMKELFN